MDVYISKSHSHKQAVTAFFLLTLLFALPVNGQRLTTTDTLLYRHHYPGQDAYPELPPEDSYMELYVQDGIVRKGFFWGTTDMMDHAREGYACGFFVLPMTDITHAMDSVSFTLKTVKDNDGKLVNIFTSLPVNLHVYHWEEAVKQCNPWESFTTSLADSVWASIRPLAAPRDNLPEACPLPDSVIVCRWMDVLGCSDSDSMLFVRERRTGNNFKINARSL